MAAGLDRHEVIVIGGGQAGLALGWVKDDAQHIAEQISKLGAARDQLPPIAA
jgi:hypothetical protein